MKLSLGKNFEFYLIPFASLIFANFYIYIHYLKMIEIVGRRRFYNIANNLPKFHSWLYSQGNHFAFAHNARFKCCSEY